MDHPLAPAVAELDMPGWAIRLEAKVDVALSQHGSDIQRLDKGYDDHEQRLRSQEAKPTVSPKALFAAVASAVGLALGLVQLLNLIVK